MGEIETLVRKTLARPVPAEIRAMAEAVTKDRDGIAAVLAYGSSLRGVAADDTLIDLYLLTEDLAGVSAKFMSRLACGLVPPNVYYAEASHAGRTLRAKYAVVPLATFAARMRAANPYFWARFAQPAALISTTDEDAVVAAIAEAARAMFGHALALAPGAKDLDIWREGFAHTYATEFRSEEGRQRAAAIVAANADYYAAAALALRHVAPRRANWARLRFFGKLWSVARLFKAAFTFSGGADYIVWKIERHSGEKIVLSPWQRRHPLLAAPLLLPRLLRRGAIR